MLTVGQRVRILNKALSNHFTVRGPPLYLVANSNFSSVKGSLCQIEKVLSFQREPRNKKKEKKRNRKEKQWGTQLIPPFSSHKGKRDILEKIYYVNLKTRSRVRSAMVAGLWRK